MKKSFSALPKTIPTILLALLLTACNGDSPESLLASGKDYLAKNDTKAALIQLKNALQQDSGLTEARYLLGKALLESGDPTGAAVELRKALDMKYSADTVVPLLARAMLATGQASKLLEEFGKTTLSSGESQAALKTTLSNANLVLGRNELAKNLLAEALTAKPDYLPALLLDVRQTASSKDFASANSKIDALLTQHPKNAEIQVLKGSLVAANGKRAEALEYYRKAIDVQADYLPAHSAIILASLQLNQVDESVKQLEALKKVAPKHPQTYFLDAQVNYQRKEFKAARESIQQVLRSAPNNAAYLQTAGAIEYQLQSYLQAETYLAKALQLAPELQLPRRLLIASHLRTGQPAKALEVLRPVLGRIDQDAALLALAGEVYLQQGEPAKATEYFSKASKLEPEDSGKKTSLALAHMAQGNVDTAFHQLEQISASDKGISADLALIAAYLKNNQVDKALKAIDHLEAKQPENPGTHNLKARALLAKKDIPGARKSFEKALSINPKFFPAVAALASLDLYDKKPDEAKKRFEAVLASDPKNAQALLALAELKAANGGTPEEVASLISNAVSATPTEPTPRLALIQYYLKNKDNKKALAAANEAATAIPDKPEILDALGKTQQISGDLNQALTTFGKLATLQPNSPLPQLRVAEIHFANKNKDEGIKSLKKALDIKPDILDAQRALIQIALENKDQGAALNIAKTVQKQRPKEAVGYAFEGDIYAAGKSFREAIAAYSQGMKVAATPELAIKLHGIQMATGNGAEGEKVATSWLKDHPKDVVFRLYMGDTATAQKNYSLATTHYQSALALQPNNALILNNLAWASGQMKSPKALEYAEKANQLAPNQPAFLDTLAMLLAEKGETSKAIDLLRKAMEISPQAASIQLNLAKVLINAGKKDEARKELDALSKLGEKFPQQSAVTELMKSI